MCLAYGGREEIVEAVKSIAQKVENKQITSNQIDESFFESHLYTQGIPDPDLIIRTSGEERLSGFLLWQSAYSEVVFQDVYWPEFRKIDFLRCLREYVQRDRRFGK